MKPVFVTLAVFCLSLFLAAPVQAKRYGLIIGNAGYDTLKYLPPPHTDATADRETFDEAAFDTQLLNDLSRTRICLLQGGCSQQASLRLQPEPTQENPPEPQEQPQAAPQAEPQEQPQAAPQVEPQPAAMPAQPPASLRDQMASSTAVRGCDRFGLSPTHPDILLGIAHGSGLSWEELDGARAERLCRAALEEFPNHPRLLSSLGRGLNKQSSYSAALSVYQDSAQAGDIVAMHNLGVMYQIGQGVPENQMVAASWYQKSADLGYSYSQFNLGLLFAHGNGVSKDPRRAAQWYLRAAKQGHADAQVWVGHSYQYGQGAAVDPLEAARWYAQAQANGSDTGKARLRQLLQDKPTARQIQQKLKDMGHYTSRVDGSFGRGSFRALKKYCQCRI